jgi:hypothetical protein
MLGRKGVDALQLVFAMFILIVVTLVMIKLFTGIVKPDTLPKIDDFQQAYHYNSEKIRCGNLCNAYTSGGCSETRAAVAYCREKVSIDINNDGVTGQRKAYGIVAGIPYCEDGLYCFNIYKCECSNTELDASECLGIMKDYYTEESRSEATANQVVCNSIQPGECPKDPNLWTKKLPGFKPVILQSGPYSGQVWGADYWWKIAGYEAICGSSGSATTLPASTTTVSSGSKLTCNSPSTGEIKCDWSGCSGNTDVSVVVSGGVDYSNCNSDKSPSGSCTFSAQSGSAYDVRLYCDGAEGQASVTVI